MIRLFSIATCFLLLLMAACSKAEKREAPGLDPSIRGNMMKQVMAIQTELLRSPVSPELRERYLTLTAEIQFAIVLTDDKGNVLEANAKYQDLTGYNLEELRQLTYQQLTPEKWQRAEAEFVVVANKVPYVAFEKEYLRKDGQTVPISLTGWVIKDNNGKVIGTGSFVTDITARVKSEGF
jgi:PAS domain S-box-containing protein